MVFFNKLATSLLIGFKINICLVDKQPADSRILLRRSYSTWGGIGVEYTKFTRQNLVDKQPYKAIEK